MPNRALPHVSLSLPTVLFPAGVTIPADAMRRGIVVAALFLGAPLLFSVNMVVARAMGGAVPPLTLAFGRWLMAALLVLPFVLPALRRGALRWDASRQLIVPVLLGGVLSVAPQYAAAAHTSAGNIALIFAATPLLVTGLERLFWTVPLPGRMLAGAVLGTGGIIVMAFQGEWTRLLSLQGNAGDVLALGAALGWAAYTARLRHCPAALPPLLFLWGLAAGAALGLAPAMAVEWVVLGPPALNGAVLGGMLCLALVAGVGAYLAYNRLVVMVGPATASLSMYLMPVYALALGALILGEALHPYHGAALLLIVGGVAVGSAAARKD